MKNMTQVPLGIIITMGKEVLDANGGPAQWQEHFESCVRSEDSGFWLHKSRMAPKQDIAVIYVIAVIRVTRYSCRQAQRQYLL